ncbi:MAG: hypothetical protein JNM63_13150 [Spirochaetia bacterium]|nr:hypothetical protein [Spirochaetia bacterium]
MALLAGGELWAQKSKQKIGKSPAVAFLDDLYQAYEDMGGVLTFRTTFQRDRVQSIHFDQLWNNLNIDPSAASAAYKPFLSALPFPILFAGFRFNPVKPLTTSINVTYRPTTGQSYIDAGYGIYTASQVQIQNTINIAETIQIGGTYTYASTYIQTRWSNNQGGVLDQEGISGDKQNAINGSYNHRTHTFGFELKQLKNLFFEPRLKIDLVNDQYSYFRSAEIKYDPYIRSGNTSDYTDGLNGMYENNYLTLSTGFTLRPNNNMVLSAKYSLTPSLLETTTALQSFNTHNWNIQLNYGIDKHFRITASFTINRSYEYRWKSPNQSFLYDNTFETQDPAVNTAVNTRALSLLYYNERNLDYDTFSVTVEYR